jgi:hypothetical protein
MLGVKEGEEIFSHPRQKLGSMVPGHDASKIGRPLPLLETPKRAEGWVPAFARTAKAIASMATVTAIDSQNLR